MYNNMDEKIIDYLVELMEYIQKKIINVVTNIMESSFEGGIKFSTIFDVKFKAIRNRYCQKMI